MVCSEFISNLWQRCGLTIGFVPSSSNRPFDLLDDERFNFLVHGVHFGDLSLVKGTARIVDAHWKSDAKTKECSPPLDDPIAYLNAIRAEAGAPQVTSLAELKQHLPIIPETYAVQSSAFKSTLSDLYIRAAGVGVLFSVTSFLFTPLNFLSVEQQLGVFLVRGNMWSFGFGMFAKNLVFTTAQCLFLFAVTRRAAKQHHSSVVMKTDAPCESAVADLRHPYYEVVRSVAASCVVGHLVSCPVSNWVLYYHFGRQHPGPLPLRLLMRGGLLLTPFCLFLPLQASWVYWYETVGSLIIPTRSSIFRPREDLLQKEYWPHYRMDALFGAAAATLGIDLCRYAVATRVRRSFLKDVYYPSAVPSFGRRKFLPGYRFRLAANAGIFTISASILHLYTLL
ncbi:hypothetical protein AGDE_04718 [Angomonas deanei]|nr:hypothetical protein AGDE_11390 [Angomonas deanei]EPY36967.1 hypothetical protein AGDE_06652 [Angomonas deanei]EPY39210.1 hypothetical protein AGDE_04718 [Angomonas deanei]|eukprot:EPY26372.1 hypothetical protein AGDE_11390 [Angomonas deanei]